MMYGLRFYSLYNCVFLCTFLFRSSHEQTCCSRLDYHQEACIAQINSVWGLGDLLGEYGNQFEVKK